MSEPRRLFVVREKFFGKGGGSNPPNTDGRMIGVFPTRQQAEARMAEAEIEAGQSGNFWPLYHEDGLEALMAYSDFEPGVFRDWMADHSVPDPASGLPTLKRHESPWYVWLMSLSKEQLGRLYEAMHHFRFYEIIEIPCVEQALPESEWQYPELHVAIDPPGLYSYPPLDEDEPR